MRSRRCHVCVWTADPEVAAEADEVLDKHVRAAIGVYFTHIPGTDYYYYHPKESANNGVGRDLLDEMGAGDSSDSDSGAGDYDFADAHDDNGRPRPHHRCELLPPPLPRIHTAQRPHVCHE